MTLKLKYEKYEKSQLGKGRKKDRGSRRKSQKREKSRYKAPRWDRAWVLEETKGSQCV